MKIDKRKSYYLIVDTETANSLEDSLFYDMGMAIIDKQGNVYESYSFVNNDIFKDENELMKSAYYANKIPLYYQGLWNNDRIPSTTWGIKSKIAELCKKYDVKAIMAHNARFDIMACNKTLRYITKSKYRYFFPYGIPIWDTLQMARSVILKMPTYESFCDTYGYYTATNQKKATAEVLYRFISANLDFEESHMGLEDVMIEKEIFAYCVKQHKAMKKEIFSKKS
jgi:hypothetical protein